VAIIKYYKTYKAEGRLIATFSKVVSLLSVEINLAQMF